MPTHFTAASRWAVLLLLAGCTGEDPWGPVGAVVPFAPPPEYRTYYAAMEACSGRTGDFDAISWWLADSLRTPPGELVTKGEWEAPHTIRLRRGYEGNDWIVDHEMLHDLLQTTAHPSPPFGVCDAPEPSAGVRPPGPVGGDARTGLDRATS